MSARPPTKGTWAALGAEPIRASSSDSAREASCGDEPTISNVRAQGSANGYHALRCHHPRPIPIDRKSTFELLEPAYALRPYQKRAVDEILTELSAHGRVLLHAPTGAGKTRMAMTVVTMWMRQRSAEMVLWLAPTVELVSQAARDFTTAWERQGDVDAAVIQWHSRGENFEHGTTIQRNTLLVAGLQMAGPAILRNSWIEQSLQKRVGLVVFDEAHHSVARTYGELVENITSAGGADRPLLGLSATPGRADEEETRALAKMYRGRKVCVGNGGNPVRYLTNEGYLSRATIVSNVFDGTPAPSSLSGDGDYPKGATDSLGDDDKRNERIVEIVKELFDTGHRRVVVFTPSIRSAAKCAEKMKARGYARAFAVSSETPPHSREHYINTFRMLIADLPDPQAIFNCNILTAGFDVPEISAAIIGSPTKSSVRLQQMIGRALRGPKSGGTETAEIRLLVDSSYTDFVNLAEMFSEWDRLWDPSEAEASSALRDENQ